MLHSIQKEQFIKSDLQTIWDFISSPANLQRITPTYMGFKILNDPGSEIYAGQIIEYHVKPVAGIKLHWITEITQVQDRKYFIDEQRFGPYAFWHHKHFLEEANGGVIMKDLVHYKLPFGILGVAANALFVKKQLQSIFEYRDNQVNSIFNK